MQIAQIQSAQKKPLAFLQQWLTPAWRRLTNTTTEVALPAVVVPLQPVPNYTGDRVVIDFTPAAIEAMPLVQRLLDVALLGPSFFGRLNAIDVIPADELLWMRLMLPGADPDGADIQSTQININVRQYAKLKRWLGTQILWIQQHKTTLLWDVEADVLLFRLRLVMNDILRRTYILTDEAWER